MNAAIHVFNQLELTKSSKLGHADLINTTNPNPNPEGFTVFR